MTLMAERSKFQFRMRDLLWAVSLIGVAAGLWAINPSSPGYRSPAALGFICSSGVCFGAGIGCLFHKPVWGAVAGLVVAAVLALPFAGF
jgi:hypothetical protein